MCIILTCDQQVRPSADLIKTCFDNNPDGAGLMWHENGKVIIDKGYVTPEALIDAISEVPLQSRLVIHMRIATSGGVSVGTCHPFPICDDLDVIHAAGSECLVGIAHNGIISNMHTDLKKGISDTVSFVTDVMDPMMDETNWTVTKNVLNRIKREAPGNRFAMMDSEGQVYRVGVGWNTVSKGIQASNSSWRYKKLSYKDLWGGRSYTWPKATSYEWSGYYVNDEDDSFDSWFDEELVRLFDDMCGRECLYRQDCMLGEPSCPEVACAVEHWYDGMCVEDAVDAGYEMFDYGEVKKLVETEKAIVPYVA